MPTNDKLTCYQIKHTILYPSIECTVYIYSNLLKKKTMDVTFIVLTCFLIILIIALYAINIVKTTSNLDDIFVSLALTNPTIVSFCVGYNEQTKKYRNAVSNRDGNIVIQENDYPIGLDGQYIVLKDHGTVTDAGDGFKISGMDLVTFKCPNGFKGPTCQLAPICDDPNDNDRRKALTYTQFNALALYNNTFPHSQVDTFNAYATEPTHPRIRIHCQTGGEYVLEICPDNKLLDANLVCQPYDICEDKLNGFKHNYQISSTTSPPNKTEYYICENNKSILTKCTDGTVFSYASKGCISESPCYGKGSATLPIDNNNYIQCNADAGTTINCEKGVVERNGVLSCFIPTCRPQKFSIDTGLLRYDYGETSCNDDNPTTILCDNSPNPKIYRYEWAEKFEYAINDWPKQILLNGSCVTPNDNDIFKNSIIKLAWTEAMPEEHDFDLKTQQYICSSDYKYRWDYIAQKSVPDTSNDKSILLATAAPCQNEAVNHKITFYKSATYYPPNKIWICASVPVSIPDFEYGLFLWPCFNPITKAFLSTKIIFDYIEQKVTVTTYDSSNAPFGFYLPEDISTTNAPESTIFLKLAGYKEFAPPTWTDLYYFNITGSIDLPVYSDSDISAAAEYNILSTLNTTISTPQSFFIDWNKIPDTGIDLLINCKLYPTAVEYNGDEGSQSSPAGFCMWKFIPGTPTGTLKYQNLNIQFNTLLITKLDFEKGR